MDEEQKTTEVRESKEKLGDTTVTRQTVASESSISAIVLVQRVIYYLLGAIVTFLLLRIVLLLLAANQGNAFVDFVYSVSGVFAAPFFGIFGYTPTYGLSVFEVSSIVAILIYTLVAWGIVKLLGLGSAHSE